MSKVKIEGNASGTGTLTISAPNTNVDRSLTLPDGAGEILTDASTLSSSNLSGALPALDGSALTGISGGKVLQVLGSVLNTEVSTTNDTYTGTGLSVDITPSSTSNKIVLMFTAGKVRTNQVHGQYMFSIFRDSTNVHNDHGAVCRGRYPTYSNVQHALSITALDSPSSTSQITYEVKFRHATSGETVSMNNAEDGFQPNASLVVMEVAV